MQNYSGSLLKALRSLRSDPATHDTRELEACEAAWLSGYFAGLAQAKLERAPDPQLTAAEPAGRVLILYGSETGNAERVARQLGERLSPAGTAVEVRDLASYKARALEREQTVVIVTSTHGDGTPPEPARRFFEQLHAASGPRSLTQLRFAVLGLGDSSYEHFCRAARVVDERLAELGAQRIAPRVDCDVDFAEPAAAWIEALFPQLTRPRAGTIQLVGAAAQAAPAVTHDARRPFLATVLENFKLTGRGSTKETRHLALQIDPAAIKFEPGDSLGICAPNDPALAHKLARSLGLSGDELVSVGAERTTLSSALIDRVDLNLATPRFLRDWAQLSGAPLLMELCACPESEQRKFLRGHHVLDLVRLYPPANAGADPTELAELLVRGLRRLTPRLYSIASSAAAISDEAHLAIATVRYALHGRSCSGVASGHIADRLREGDTLPVYVQPNPSFKLPTDPDAKLLMIGAGTGVAPYRAFMQERCARGARGQSWLFFGERSFRNDFLYQTEWQGWVRDGSLSRISLAFSRDQATKIYVQSRMLEHAHDVYAWLSEGAYVYVCGDASAMAHRVHEALLQIIERQKGSRERAEEYLYAMAEARRYQRDVY